MGADVQYILAARIGRVAMLQAMFGKPDPDTDKPKRKAKGAEIISFARTHNALRAAGKIGRQY